MKKLILGTLGLLALASCSDDELTSVNRDGDEITFNVVSNAMSRANAVYCNANLPDQFYLSATYDGKKYIDSDNVDYIKKETTGKWVNTSGTRYWPATGDVTFFAYCNVEPSSFVWNATRPTVDFTVDETVTDQKDFIYAKKTQSKPNDDAGQVTLNFRHALSQIVFMGKNTNPNLYVEIYGVSVCNVKGGTATFTYPEDDTSTNMEDATTGGGKTNHDGSFNHTGEYNTGSWNVSGATTTTTPGVDYTVTLDSKVSLEGSKNATAESLTNNVKVENGASTEFNQKAMLLFPQVTSAWDPANQTANAPGDDAAETGSYFLVKCQIWNVAGTEFNAETDVCLWGNKEEDNTYTAKNIAIPVSFNWEQGKKYIYTFVFGDGNGGYNPEEPNEQILVPITFNVTVDDFVNGGNTDKNMET